MVCGGVFLEIKCQNHLTSSMRLKEMGMNHDIGPKQTKPVVIY